MAVNVHSMVSHLIVDSAPFLKRTRLETFGCRIYTTPGVISELRDPHVRETLKSLPYKLHLESPSTEALKLVTAKSKETGDFSVLSTTDLNLIALTYDLHKTHVGDPTPKPVPLPNDLGQKAHTFISESSRKNSDSDNDTSSSVSSVDGEDTEEKEDAGPMAEEDTDLPSEADWITEHNFEQKALDNFGLGVQSFNTETPLSACTEDDPPPVVACLTTDFAMQNVLFHLGLQLISLKGMRITTPRTHLLWCGSCFRPTKRTDTYFCPYCAQANLRRIPVTLEEDGQLKFHFSRRFVKSLRGSRQPIRRPRGGKHADEPIYCPDQRLPDRRPAKLKNPDVQYIATNGILDELADELDSICEFGDGSSAFPLHDVNSRSARVGIRSDHQIPVRSWFHPKAEHGLKPTRGKAHIPKPRTGNKKKKRKI
ncbi:unnamed protein product [Dicrocoelium dendriticum]|nr:unnamed protein product [Dicrocoelium dendriticum]